MQRYEHSGAVPLTGILVFLPIAVVGAILGVVYDYLIVWIPLIYINFLVTAGFGALLGGICGRAARAGKIRNTPVTAVLTFVIALVAYYASWAVDPLARFGPADGAILISPIILAQYIEAFFQQGTWTLFGDQSVSGIFLAAVWLVEAAVIFGGATVIAVSMTRNHPFCEMCHRWTTKEDDVRRMSLIGAEPAAIENISAGKIDVLEKLAKALDEEAAYLRVDLASCPDCSQSSYVSVQLVSSSVDKKGNESTATKAVLENLSVDAAETERVSQVGRERTNEELAKLLGEDVTDGGDADDSDPEQPPEAP